MKSICGLRFSTAGIVVGLLYLFISLYSTIHGIINLVKFFPKEQRGSSSWLIHTDLTFLNVSIVVLSVAGLLSSILLIWGTFKKRHLLLIPWLVFGVAFMMVISVILLYIVNIFIAFFFNGMSMDGTVVILFVVYIAALALQIYLWKGIQYLYIEFQTANIQQREKRNMNATSAPLYPAIENIEQQPPEQQNDNNLAASAPLYPTIDKFSKIN